MVRTCCINFTRNSSIIFQQLQSSKKSKAPPHTMFFLAMNRKPLPLPELDALRLDRVACMVAADSTDSVIAELAKRVGFLVGRKSVVRVRAITPADRVRLGWELLVSSDFVCQILSLTPTCREASTASVFFELNAATQVNLICSVIGIASFTLRHQAFTHGSGTASRGTRGVTTSG